MSGHDGWQYQGRQEHGWFGTGIKPQDAAPGRAKRTRSTAFRRSFRWRGNWRAAPQTGAPLAGSGAKMQPVGPVLRIRYTLPGGPVPFPLPPVFLPGTPQNEDFVTFTYDALRAIGSGIASIFHSQNKSPDIDPSQVVGKKPSEFDDFARRSGLIPKGPDPKHGRGAYIDPVTGKQRVLIHPRPHGEGHAHANDSAGRRVNKAGKLVPAESPDAHLPLGHER